MAEEKTYFGKCTYCLNYGYIFSMWEKYVNGGETEIYGLMLIQCFDISALEDEQICEDCAWKLREAYLFKKQVQRSQKQLNQIGDSTDVEVVIKPEQDDEDYIVEYLEEEVLDSFEQEHFESEGGETVQKESGDVTSKESGDETDKESGDETYKESLDGDVADDAFEEYEELDKDEVSESQSIPVVRKRAPRSAARDDDDDNKTKWPRKLPKEERYKTYKQYTEEALKRAIAAVMSGRLNVSDAASHYRVPKKTLSAKLRDLKNNKKIFPTKSSPLAKELAILLKHVNVTPFRCRANSPLCFYCPQANPFTSVADFRVHNKEHVIPTQKMLEAAMRPIYNNEIVKLDLNNLTCYKCKIGLLNWPDVLQHLETVHDVVLECKNKMIPFMLDDNSCVLCAEVFSSFMLLHAHMNKHYSNYVCGYCGDSFVSSNRLKTHQKIHETGDFPCPVCKKVFNREIYLRKHAMIHTDEMKVKCQHCNEVFKTEHQRQVHKIQSHKDLVEFITCELCGTTFHWMRYFLKHMKRMHGTQYRCEQCSKFFHSKVELKAHVLTHVGAKEYKCLVCCKKFFSRTSLRSHLKYSHQNINVD